MKKLVKDKRGADILHGTIIFIILNVIFFAALFIFVARAGTGVSVKEQINAKQIALLIDQAKPGTELEVDLSEMYKVAEKNKFTGKVIDINYAGSEIIIRLESGGGYSHHYFTELESGSVSLDEENKLLKIKV